MVEQSAVFAWYELLTTDVSAAQSFYGKVVGWDVQDAPPPPSLPTGFSASAGRLSRD